MLKERIGTVRFCKQTGLCVSWLWPRLGVVSHAVEKYHLVSGCSAVYGIWCCLVLCGTTILWVVRTCRQLPDYKNYYRVRPTDQEFSTVLRYLSFFSHGMWSLCLSTTHSLLSGLSSSAQKMKCGSTYWHLAC